MKRVAVIGLVFLLAAAAASSACGGGDGDSGNQGAAAAAVAQYFIQERDGGRLPEGTQVRGIGIESNRVVTLDVRDEDEARNVKERYCMEYRYQVPADGFRELSRVYVAELIDGAWAVEAVNPNGTCEGVE